MPADPAAASEPEAEPTARLSRRQSAEPVRPAPSDFRSGPPSDQPRRPPWQPGRRSFLTASAAGRGRGRRRRPGRPGPHRALQRIGRPVPHPVPAGRAPGAAAAGRREPRHPGPEPVRHPELRLLPGGHRADPAPGGAADLAAAHPRDGGARDHHQLPRPAEAPADRGLDHAVLRLQPGGRPLHRERQVARRQPGQPAAGRRGSGPAPTSCCAPRPTGSPRAPRWPRSWTAGTRCWPWP